MSTEQRNYRTLRSTFNNPSIIGAMLMLLLLSICLYPTLW